MNLYFLVEGKRCERKIYPSWLSHLAPDYGRLVTPASAVMGQKAYYLISGEGYPSILHNHLPNAIRDVENNPVFAYLIVVIDADEQTVASREAEVHLALARSDCKLYSADLRVVVQNRCIETWLLGNRRIVPRQPQNQELSRYIRHFNVSELDPEDMPKLDGFNTHAQFHATYLRRIFEERNIHYTKKNPGVAKEAYYLDEMRARVDSCAAHLRSFQKLLRLCKELSTPQD